MIPSDRFPQRLASLEYTAHSDKGAEYILPPLCPVPAGPFLMGSDPNQYKEADDDEQPQQWVTVPAFEIARYPVTVAEYACFVRAGHTEPKRLYDSPTWQKQRESPDHPVVNVSWFDAVSYTVWLAQVTGQPWRLPTEAEWEKAARWDPLTGTSRIYPWGDILDVARCNVGESHTTTTTTTTPVGSYPSGASPCGAQDMEGNVWEWTSSLFKPYPYEEADGREDKSFAGERVLRGGGAWDQEASSVAFRNHGLPDSTLDLGFRLVRARS
jgi:formylglycine-generating enzyme required for sulfatase activity